MNRNLVIPKKERETNDDVARMMITPLHHSASPSSPTTPSARDRRYTPSGDKAELSPNSWASCQVCRSKIDKGAARIGKDIFYEPIKAYIFKYYHKHCFEAANLTLQTASGRSFDDEIAHANKMRVQHDVIVRERDELRERLRQLRLLFARALQQSAFVVFDDKVLRQLVLTMPVTKEELLQVHGFKEKKYRSFGEPILQVIRQYRRVMVYGSKPEN
ncbi:hypothetical protein MPSEU_000164800 [Mayamaea pseudoterrestris]|nr:hypothetical protein MPSEU_000164800 [Mayamaea pseudoterrestris]